MVWDYQLVGGGTEEQIQVVLVAIKADLLNEINSAVEATELRTSIVDVAPGGFRTARASSYATRNFPAQARGKTGDACANDFYFDDS